MNVAIVKYIAEEVWRQGDDTRMVGPMADAWELAIEQKKILGHIVTPTLIEHWGRRVHPVKNAKGFRDGYVRVGNRMCPPPSVVHYHIEDLCADIHRGISPESAYYNFQLTHPFADGNGRTGKILYNYLKDTLQNPVFPPDFFGGIRNP